MLVEPVKMQSKCRDDLRNDHCVRIDALWDEKGNKCSQVRVPGV